MKTHTQQQTNLKKETTATEPKLSSRKRSEYKPRKWRGNTLVPVIIGLAISAIATVTFLNQGASLAADNKSILAQNEIASIMNSWNILRASYAAVDIQLPAGPLNLGQVAITSSMLEVNIYGTAVVFNPGLLALQYTTDNEGSCESIQIGVDNMLGVSNTGCDIDGLLTITLQ
ncbi:hypothetical protein N9I32_04705 [Porticoccaceae bacterium]|nr:hypothetical protein [Porticoccaceae bacterium]